MALAKIHCALVGSPTPRRGFRREFGCYNQTPHDVVLAWLEDCLYNWKKANFGWALWQLRGAFGILDSGRKDVEYENFHGHQLDRKMLDLLLKYR